VTAYSSAFAACRLSRYLLQVQVKSKIRPQQCIKDNYSLSVRQNILITVSQQALASLYVDFYKSKTPASTKYHFSGTIKRDSVTNF